MKSIVEILHRFNCEIIIEPEQFGIFKDDEIRKCVTRHIYRHLTDEEYRGKLFQYFRCGQCATIFSEILTRYGYPNKTIFVDNGYLANTYDVEFNYEYINLIMNNEYDGINKYEQRIIFDGKKTGTHALIEIENGKVLDPMVGILYNAGMDELISGKVDVSTSWSYLDQYRFFKDNYQHWGVPAVLLYATKKYWSSVIKYKDLDYLDLFDIDKTLYDKINKFCEEK